MLENVRLKVEAFEYLQLPFDITEGCIGRVEVQARFLTAPTYSKLCPAKHCMLCLTSPGSSERHVGCCDGRSIQYHGHLCSRDMVAL